MKERGNILFLILLAIILFVALSYAVSSGMRGGGKDGSPEKVSSQAATLLQQASLIQNTVNRLRLTNGCTDTEISFENPTVSGYTNPNSPGDKRCNLFDPAGGGLSWFTPDAAWLDPTTANLAMSNYGKAFYGGRNCVVNIGTGGVSCQANADPSAAELMLFVGYLTQSLCQELARRTDTINGNAIPIEYNESYPPTQRFTGTYAGPLSITNTSGSDTSGTLTGKLAGCYQSPSDATLLPVGSYHFYYVLLAR